jgi:hypothetical protein
VGWWLGGWVVGRLGGWVVGRLGGWTVGSGLGRGEGGWRACVRTGMGRRQGAEEAADGVKWHR